MIPQKHYMKNTDAAAIQNRLKQKSERLVDDALQMKAPRSFIVSQGATISKLKTLIKDMRQVMEPYTAAKLQDKRNSLKDFLAMASFFHVTHLITFSESVLDTPYMRICRLPQGPTLSFKIHAYSLMKDVGRMFKKNYGSANEYMHSPLVILNGFTKEPHCQLMSTMFQNMFPTISVKTLKLSHCKRVVMFNYNKETKMVQMRHYVVLVNHSGVNRAVKKVSKVTKSANLRNFSNAADFVLSGGAGAVSSDSEMDETGMATVAPQQLSKGIQENTLVSVRLREVGPRLDLELVKVQDGFFEGKTIYHAYSIRTPQEEMQIVRRKQQEKALKERRRLEQEENVKRKKEAKGKKTEGEEDEEEDGDQIMDIPEVDDDAEYYRQEVGEEPDEDFLLAAQRRKSPKSTTTTTTSSKPSKKNKSAPEDGPKKKKAKN